MKKLAILGVLLLGLSPAAGGKKLEIDPGQHYLLLATKRTKTMQKKLDEAAKQGFIIRMGSPTSGSEIVLLLERVAEPPDTYTYHLLATQRTRTFQKELDQAAQIGFRLLPRTMMAKRFAVGNSAEIVAILERPSKIEKHYQYKLLATVRTSTLQKEIEQAQARGYVLVGMVSRGEHMVIMKKESPAPE